MKQIILILLISVVYITVLYPLIQTKKIIATILTFLCLLILLSQRKPHLGKTFLMYFCIASFGILSFFIYSLFLQNDPARMVNFITPLAFLLLFPCFQYLVQIYRKRFFRMILFHFHFASFLLSIFIILVYVMIQVQGFSNIERLLTDYEKNFGIMYSSGTGYRVSVLTAVLLVPGFLIGLYSGFNRNGDLFKPSHFRNATILTSIFMTKTFGIWIALFIALAYCLYTEVFRNVLIRFCCIITLILILISVGFYSFELLASDSVRVHSLNIKVEQVENGLKLFFEKPLLGQGLGSIKNLDHRNSQDHMIEVLPILLLVDTGLIGLAFYTWLYLFPFVKPLIGTAEKWSTPSCLFACHISILFAGFSNPYFLSGSVGFFFILMVFTYAYNENHIGRFT